jgi:protein SCO1/2
MAYFHCETLCPLVFNGITKATNEFDTQQSQDFEVLIVSIDPRDTAAEAAIRKQTFLARTRLNLRQDQVHFLTGSASSIDALADAVGFRYRFDPRTGQYEHPSGLMILTANGLISRYFFGIEYDAQDLRKALLDASHNSLGQTLRQWVLACYRFNSETGAYTQMIYHIMRVLAVVLLVGGGFMLYRWEQRRLQAK